MEKKNESTVKKDETMELTPEQMEKVSGGGAPEIMGLLGGESEDKDDRWLQH